MVADAQNAIPVASSDTYQIDSVTGARTPQQSTGGAAHVLPAGHPYALIGASATAAVPGGGVGAAGDYLDAIIVTANTGTITVLDGLTTVLVIPAAVAVGARYELKANAATKWNITTGASTGCVCVGKFS